MTVSKERNVMSSVVALIAAGPGDPDLMTVRAVQLLQRAQVVIADADAVELARDLIGDDERLTTAIDDNGLPLDHRSRAKLVAEHSRKGIAVVRLLSGDPILDGSLLIEVQALRKAKVNFEIVPGVSPVNGVPAYAGFSLTGGKSREVSIVDAHDTDLDWSAHARTRETIIVLNGADRAVEIAA